MEVYGTVIWSMWGKCDSAIYFLMWISGTAESRQCAWQYLIKPQMEAVDQYMCGLRNPSQGMPRTVGDNKDKMTNSSMNYMNDTVNFMGSVLCVSATSRLPFMANVFLWTDSSTSCLYQV